MAASDFEPPDIESSVPREPADEDVTKDLIARYSHIVENAVRRIPPTNRKDVIQDAWVRVLGVLPRYDKERASLEAVVQGCARLAVMQFWRQYYQDPTSLGKLRCNEDRGSLEDLECATPFASPEGQIARVELLKLAVWVALGADTPPHQAIVFAYRKLLDWTNSRIINERERCQFRECGAEVWRAFICVFPGHREWCDPIFEAFVDRLNRPLAALITNAKSRKPYGHLLDRQAKDTRIADYFQHMEKNRRSLAPGVSKKEKSDQLTKWCDSVRRRILTAVAVSQSNHFETNRHANTD